MWTLGHSMMFTRLIVLQFDGIRNDGLAGRRYSCLEFVNKNCWFRSIRSGIATSRFCDFNIFEVWTLASRFNSTTQVGHRIEEIIVRHLLVIGRPHIVSGLLHICFWLLEVLLHILRTWWNVGVLPLQSHFGLTNLIDGFNCSIYGTVEVILLLSVFTADDNLVLNGHSQYYLDEIAMHLVQMPKVHTLLMLLKQCRLPRIERLHLIMTLILYCDVLK